jgi:hypothetical protein
MVEKRPRKTRINTVWFAHRDFLSLEVRERIYASALGSNEDVGGTVEPTANDKEIRSLRFGAAEEEGLRVQSNVIPTFPHAFDGFSVAAAAEKFALAGSFFVKLAARSRDDGRDDVKKMVVPGG